MILSLSKFDLIYQILRYYLKNYYSIFTTIQFSCQSGTYNNQWMIVDFKLLNKDNETTSKQVCQNFINKNRKSQVINKAIQNRVQNSNLH